ncbi:MAG: protein containing YHS domain protein, partial [Candidatus Hydrogenedentota bacterium]
EFAIAYEEGKLIGVLTGTGGITDVLPELVDSLDKNTGSEVVYDADSHQLIARLLDRFQSPGYACACKHDAAAAG